MIPVSTLGKDIVEIRFHGRGGQGAVTAAQILVDAAVREGKWGQAIPLFGAERRGAPVVAYARIGSRPVPLHSGVYEPHVVVILDPFVMLVSDVLQGLRRNGVVVVNSPKPPLDIASKRRDASVYYVDATGIARRLGLIVAGWPVVNTSMLGALAKATGIVGIGSIIEAIRARWPGRLGEANAEAARLAYEATRRVELVAAGIPGA